MAKKSLFCPLSNEGCETTDQKCMLWRPRGCQLEKAIEAVKTIPNLLRHIERQIERGKQETS